MQIGFSQEIWSNFARTVGTSSSVQQRSQAEVNRQSSIMDFIDWIKAHPVTQKHMKKLKHYLLELKYPGENCQGAGGSPPPSSYVQTLSSVLSENRL